MKTTIRYDTIHTTNCFKEEHTRNFPSDWLRCFGSDKNLRMSCQNVALAFKPHLYRMPLYLLRYIPYIYIYINAQIWQNGDLRTPAGTREFYIYICMYPMPTRPSARLFLIACKLICRRQEQYETKRKKKPKRMTTIRLKWKIEKGKWTEGSGGGGVVIWQRRTITQLKWTILNEIILEAETARHGKSRRLRHNKDPSAA